MGRLLTHQSHVCGLRICKKECHNCCGGDLWPNSSQKYEQNRNYLKGNYSISFSSLCLFLRKVASGEKSHAVRKKKRKNRENIRGRNDFDGGERVASLFQMSNLRTNQSLPRHKHMGITKNVKLILKSCKKINCKIVQELRICLLFNDYFPN